MSKKPPKSEKNSNNKIKHQISNNDFIYIIVKEKGNPIRAYKKIKAYSKIQKLNLFDGEYYLKKYPKLEEKNVNPLNHYIYHGYKERKRPSKSFDGNYYLKKYPDVKKSNQNPLIHYVLYGKNESRFGNKNEELQSPKRLYSKLKKQEVIINEQKKRLKVQEEELTKQKTCLIRELNNQKESLKETRGKIDKHTLIDEIPYINKEKIASEIENFKGYGITKEKRSPKLIISITSYPERMYDVHYTIYSLLKQTYPPDKVLLWLSPEEFPNLEEDIPKRIIDMEKFGLTIKWCENIRSYKKLVCSLKEYPEDIIVTADDDLFFPKDWLEKLYNTYKENPENIICHRAHLVNFDGNSINPYNTWEKEVYNNNPSFLNFSTGGAGTLYPPNSLHKDVLSENKFLKLAPTADDVWFWSMGIINNTKIKIVKSGYPNPHRVNPQRDFNLNDENTLYYENSRGKNDNSIENIIKEYPQIIDKLKKELEDNFSSKDYWESRYHDGGNSGVGSYNIFAEFKAEILNNFVLENNIESVIEFGFGDGNQLSFANYPKFTGFDVSETVVKNCKIKFKNDKTKKFYILDDYKGQKADLTLSLDVIYHLSEYKVFEDYMERLFNASKKYVIIYSSNYNREDAVYIKHRKFTDYVEKNMSRWKLIQFIPNKYPYEGDYRTGSFSDFYIYQYNKK